MIHSHHRKKSKTSLSYLWEKYQTQFLRYLGGGLIYSLGVFLSHEVLYIFPAIIFGLLMILELYLVIREKGHWLDLRNFVTVSWIGGIALASMKLSYIQVYWHAKIWIALGAFYFLFLLSYDVVYYLVKKKEIRDAKQRDIKKEEERERREMEKVMREEAAKQYVVTGSRPDVETFSDLFKEDGTVNNLSEEKTMAEALDDIKPVDPAEEHKEHRHHHHHHHSYEKQDEKKRSFYTKRLYMAIWIVFLLSFTCFMVESVVFRFAYPLFSGIPHSYSEWHITGIHYFVVSCVFVPILTILYCHKVKVSKLTGFLLLLINAISFLIPVLILSKLPLVMMSLMALICWLMLQQRIRFIRIFLILGGVIVATGAVIVLLVYGRNYPEGYLEKLFRFRYNVPITFQYPYMYIVNNFENVEVLIEKLPSYSGGVRSFYPFFALTGFKFLPSIAPLFAVPNFSTIPQLTTGTIIYDVYADFGQFGVFALGLFLGGISAFVTRKARASHRVVPQVFYAMLAVLLGLSFFASWLSNPTIWFYSVAILAIGLFCKEKGETIWSETN